MKLYRSRFLTHKNKKFLKIQQFYLQTEFMLILTLNLKEFVSDHL
jgi:hypothetical protein